MLDESRSFIESLAGEIKNWTPPSTGPEVEAIKRGADLAKLQREKANADLDKRIAAQRAKIKTPAKAPAKTAFLAKNSVKIHSLAKQSIR